MCYKVLEEVLTTADATDPGSDSATVHLLMAFRAHVDVLYVHGAFEDNGTGSAELDALFKELGNGENFYDRVVVCIDQHIQDEKNKGRSPYAEKCIKEHKPVPYALFDPATIANGTDKVQKEFEALVLQQQQTAFGALFAHAYAAETYAEKVARNIIDETEVLDDTVLEKLVHLDDAVLTKLVADYHKVIMPEYKRCAQGFAAMAEKALEANPVDEASKLELQPFASTLEDPYIEKLVSELGGDGEGGGGDGGSGDVYVPKRARTAANGDLTDWRHLFPASSVGMQAPESPYEGRKKRLEELRDVYKKQKQPAAAAAADALKQLDVDPDVQFADTATFSRADFVRNKAQVVKYYKHWITNNRIQAALHVVPVVTLAVCGAGPAIAATAIVNVADRGIRMFNQRLGGSIRSVQFKKLLEDRKAVAALSLGGVYTIMRMIGMGNVIHKVAQFVLSPVFEVGSQMLLLFHAWKNSIHPDIPMTWAAPARELGIKIATRNDGGVIRTPDVVKAVNEWTTVVDNPGVTMGMESKGSRRGLGKDHALFKHVKYGPWGAANSRWLVDQVYEQAGPLQERVLS